MICRFTQLDLPADAVNSESRLLDLLGEVHEVLWPELAGMVIEVDDETDLAYFRASISTDTTLNEENTDRVFVVSYDPVVLADPPSAVALAAILAHELGHVFDYTSMNVEEYLQFGLWYGAQDPAESDELAAYERQTDEAALHRGCAAGLAEMREWIYAHATPEVLAEKQRNYYTPAEIEAWTAANGTCP